MTVLLKPGDIAPEFCLQANDGKTYRLNEILRTNLIVLYFYPKDETPGCIVEACAFRDAYEDFKDAGAEVIGISTDSLQSHKDFVQNRKLPFVLLSDPELVAHKAYGADAKFLGLLKSRITFVIDQDGVIRHVFSSQIAPKKHVKESLEALRKINSLVKK